MLKRILGVGLTLAIIITITSSMSAQGFPKIPKMPKIKIPQTMPTPSTSGNGDYIGETEKGVSAQASTQSNGANSSEGSSASPSDRQMVMDDGFTFFEAEAVKGRNAKNTGDIDVGWRLNATLRLMGTFETGSGFRVVLKKGAKELGSVDCKTFLYRKDKDHELKQMKKIGVHDDFIYSKTCEEPAKPFTDIGNLDVEIYFTEPGGSLGKLLRKHKIDVHKLPTIKGSSTAPYPGVAEYYIQRHAEMSAGILITGGLDYFETSVPRRVFEDQTNKRQIYIYLPITPDKRTTFKPQLQCSVNGRDFPINMSNIISSRPSTAMYFYESALALRNDPRFMERITFTYMKAQLPISTGESAGTTNISNDPGNWECKLVENGEVYRIFRFKVGSDGEIEQHAEQKNGNVNLYHLSYLVDVEIPESSTIDERLAPMPSAGFFYGIPWTTPEGKAAAAKIKPRGKPYPVMPK